MASNKKLPNHHNQRSILELTDVLIIAIGLVDEAREKISVQKPF
ncbi:hypothetical protein [Nitrosopumilus sp.]